MTLQVPDAFLRAVAGFDLPPAGEYAVGTAFLPVDAATAAAAVALVEQAAAQEGLSVLGWRDVPVDPSELGPTARSVMPAFRQVFLAGAAGQRGLELERMAFAARKVAERRARRGRCRAVLPVAVVANPRLQGHAHDDPAGQLLPGSAR